jgi:pyruvate formate lyase activating enzyme
MKVREVLQAIEKDRAFFDESEGGTTFSGGEPFQQPDFLNALLAECKDRDIRTVVDTCGHVQYKIIDRMRDKIDLFLYDIKTMSARKHVQYTGASNNRILENLKKLAQDGGKIMISLPIIPSINDDEMNVRKTAEFISSLRGIQQVNLLPYHRGGVEKYTSLGRAYSLKRVQPPSDHMIEAMKETIEAFGIKVGIGGG